MTLTVDDDVVGLQISKDNIAFMKHLERKQDLLSEQLCLFLRELPFDLQVLRKITPRAIVRNQEQMVLGLESIPQLDNKGMFAHQPHDIAFGQCVLLQIL